MEAPKALNGEESGEGRRKRILAYFWPQNTSGRQKNAIFSISFNFRLLVSGGH